MLILVMKLNPIIVNHQKNNKSTKNKKPNPKILKVKIKKPAL